MTALEELMPAPLGPEATPSPSSLVCVVCEATAVTLGRCHVCGERQGYVPAGAAGKVRAELGVELHPVFGPAPQEPPG